MSENTFGEYPNGRFFQLEDIAASAAIPTQTDDSDRASREERLATVRKEIRALGHINLDAIQEEQELDENPRETDRASRRP